MPASSPMKVQRWTHPFDSSHQHPRYSGYCTPTPLPTGFYNLYLRSTPHPVTVTTRIITFLVGNPYLNLHLPLASCMGGRSNLYLKWPPGAWHTFSVGLTPAAPQDDNGLSWEEFRELAVEVGELQGLSKPVTWRGRGLVGYVEK